MYSTLDQYYSFDTYKKESFREIMTLISGDVLQSFCDVSWMTHEKKEFHRSLPSSVEVKMLVNVENVDQGKILFVYTDLLDEFIRKVLPYRTKPFLLVTHNSDDSINETHNELLSHRLLLHMFSQNTFIRHNKLTALPIGIANSMWVHGNISNFQHLINHAIPFSEKKNRVYANVNKTTNQSHRSKVLESVSRYDFVDVVEPTKDHSSYLQELTTYKWVVSPKGNGVDCHRLWECLYAKCIPIVDDTVNTQEFKEMGFPIILVKDWDELTLSFLSKETSLLNTVDYSPKLNALYWKKLFTDYSIGG